jgi:pantoate--beta-alanine ligase
MHIVHTVEDVRRIRWQEPTCTWGLVPTMGALHAGHVALVHRALADNDRVAVSIFVNPLQFNRADDLAQYPRQFEQDAALLREAGVHLVWAPPPEIMYPPGFQTYVEVTNLTAPLEGVARPGHFRGVTTVVAKLFNAVQPTRAYFGQKDAQQAAVVTRMAHDLMCNLEVIVCPTMREADGLAMSSRNVHLNPAERQAATVLYTALQAAQNAWQAGTRDADTLRRLMTQIITTEPLARVDYVSVADPVSLQEITGEAQRALFSMAVFVGTTRLIDNISVG